MRLRELALGPTAVGCALTAAALVRLWLQPRQPSAAPGRELMEHTVRSMSFLMLGIWLLAVAGPASAAGDPFEALGGQVIQEPAPSPALSLPDLTGRVVAIPEAFRGKVVLLGFFTTT